MHLVIVDVNVSEGARSSAEPGGSGNRLRLRPIDEGNRRRRDTRRRCKTYVYRSILFLTCIIFYMYAIVIVKNYMIFTKVCQLESIS